MRIIHTADWHLGKSLEGRSRLPEQSEFIDELAEIVSKHSVDMIIVAGDVFDTSNPPAAAEQLFYRALDRLADGGRRAVIVIAGNHDHPERLAAAMDLARRYGIVLAGSPASRVPASHFAEDRVNIVQSGTGWLEMSLPNCPDHAVIALLPYPSESRLQEALTESLDEGVLQKAYAAKVSLILQEAAGHFTENTINLVLSHLYTAGGETSESERDISLGGALAVGSDVFPPGSHYVALGHLHRCQEIPGEETVIRYAGSPLAYSFSEAGQAKSVTLIDARLGQALHREEIFLTRGRPLVRWRADSLEQVRTWCAEGRDANAWIDLEVQVRVPLSIDETSELRGLHRGFVNIRAILPGAGALVPEEDKTALGPEEMFKRYYYSRYGGWPEPAMVQLFLELLGDTGEPSGGEVSL
ncbi:MAG: exonuclease SbcCD subunit D [Deltaproteobacteria bacterium]